MDDALWYFAYGSNMSAAIFTERRGIRPLSTRWGWLSGYRLCFDLPIGPGERGCATVISEENAQVAGILYRITSNEAEHLDRTEGVPHGIYQRIPVEVRVDGVERVAAFTYQALIRQPGRKPSARYLGLLLAGARVGGLPPEYVGWLEGFDVAFDERIVKEGPMDARTVRFYFAYNSPYAFLASARLERELAPLSVAVQYQPVYSPRTGGGPDPNSPRIKYMAEDVRRFADAYGLHMNPGPFADTRLACLGFLYARAEGRGKVYHDGVYAARFLEAQDIGQPKTLAAIAERAGLDAGCFLAALKDEQWEAALQASNQAAQADGVFGFPFFVFQGQHFWGNDRIEWLIRAIQSAA